MTSSHRPYAFAALILVFFASLSFSIEVAFSGQALAMSRALAMSQASADKQAPRRIPLDLPVFGAGDATPPVTAIL